MAKGKQSQSQSQSRKGGGTLDQQIARLSEAVGAEGVKQAQALIADVSHEVIALAFKMTNRESKVPQITPTMVAAAEALGVTPEQLRDAQSAARKTVRAANKTA